MLLVLSNGILMQSDLFKVSLPHLCTLHTPGLNRASGVQRKGRSGPEEVRVGFLKSDIGPPVLNNEQQFCQKGQEVAGPPQAEG